MVGERGSEEIQIVEEAKKAQEVSGTPLGFLIPISFDRWARMTAAPLTVCDLARHQCKGRREERR